MNDDILAEIASDLTYVEQLESDFHYTLDGDRISVQRWREDGRLTGSIGFLKFEEPK